MCKPSPLWKPAPFRRGLEQAIPRGSGVYAIIAVDRKVGLPIAAEVIYIGQSLDLRRRYVQHLDDQEPNAQLFGLAHRYAPRDIEYWWSRVPPNELRLLEKTLIQKLKPPANRRLYTNTLSIERH